VVNGALDRAELTVPELNGQVKVVEHALAGASVRAAADVLSRLGEPGQELAAALTRAGGSF
jgi:hypothetical protein